MCNLYDEEKKSKIKFQGTKIHLVNHFAGH